jgi:hypothetical protein
LVLSRKNTISSCQQHDMTCLSFNHSFIPSSRGHDSRLQSSPSLSLSRRTRACVNVNSLHFHATPMSLLYFFHLRSVIFFPSMILSPLFFPSFFLLKLFCRPSCAHSTPLARSTPHYNKSVENFFFLFVFLPRLTIHKYVQTHENPGKSFASSLSLGNKKKRTNSKRSRPSLGEVLHH